MKDLHILLTSISVMVFCWNCIKVVYMTEDWIQPTVDQVCMFLAIILGSLFAYAQGMWLTLFFFVFSFVIGIICIKIQDGFERQKVQRMFQKLGEDTITGIIQTRPAEIQKHWKSLYSVVDVLHMAGGLNEQVQR